MVTIPRLIACRYWLAQRRGSWTIGGRWRGSRCWCRGLGSRRGRFHCCCGSGGRRSARRRRRRCGSGASPRTWCPRSRPRWRSARRSRLARVRCCWPGRTSPARSSARSCGARATARTTWPPTGRCRWTAWRRAPAGAWTAARWTGWRSRPRPRSRGSRAPMAGRPPAGSGSPRSARSPPRRPRAPGCGAPPGQLGPRVPGMAGEPHDDPIGGVGDRVDVAGPEQDHGVAELTVGGEHSGQLPRIGPLPPGPIGRRLVGMRYSAKELATIIGRWSAGQGPLYHRLAVALRRLIEQGQLRPEALLPPERTLARALAVSRNTVAAAYELLRGDGLIERRQGSGTTVAPRRFSPSGEYKANAMFLSLLEGSTATIVLTCALNGMSPFVPKLRSTS